MRHLFTSILLLVGASTFAQSQVGDKLGGWYMYFWNTEIKESGFGFQGDVQLRNWNVLGDLEQLLIRGGATYSPKSAKIKFTLGYANITSGTYGDFKQTTSESRIYQEVLMPQTVGERFHLTHRFRFEERFVQDQDLKFRFRYALFMNVPFNKPKLEKGAIYLALYDELFIGADKANTGSGVAFYDRNRAYAALGYSFTDQLRMQLGYMQQSLTTYSKGQLQLSVHQKF